MSDENAERKLKITVIKLLEVAYSNNEGITTKLVRKAGPFTMRIDEKGRVELSGKMGHFKFDGKPTLEKMGVDLKMASLMFSNAGNNRLNYSAKIKLAAVELEYSSTLDVEELLLSCSGLLCIAARAMKDRTNQIDRSLQGY